MKLLSLCAVSQGHIWGNFALIFSLLGIVCLCITDFFVQMSSPQRVSLSCLNIVPLSQLLSIILPWSSYKVPITIRNYIIYVLVYDMPLLWARTCLIWSLPLSLSVWMVPGAFWAPNKYLLHGRVNDWMYDTGERH